MTTTVVPTTASSISGSTTTKHQGPGRPARERTGERTVGERNQIVLSHQWLVRAVALGFQGRGLDYEDLVSEGQLGLLRAAELFDPSYGKPLAAYAALWIRHSIAYGIASRGSMVRVPQAVRGLVGRYRRAQALRGETEDEPDLERFLGSSPVHHRLSTLRAGLAARRLHRARATDPESVNRLQAVGDGALGRVDDREWTETALARLPAREAAIVRARFGLGEDGSEQALRDVGRRFGIGPERARQLSDRAIGRIRAWSNTSTQERGLHRC
jgi:RNA polymerase primary sigma factor